MLTLQARQGVGLWVRSNTPVHMPVVTRDLPAHVLRNINECKRNKSHTTGDDPWMHIRVQPQLSSIMQANIHLGNLRPS